MQSSIEPIGPQFRDSLKEHLAPFGLPADIVEWKYFQRPWPDALTGLVWVKGGRVRGSIGLIPFHVRSGGAYIEASWTCDWVVDSPQSNPGIGVLLMQRARALAGPLFSLGGNEINRQLMPRIATALDEHAAKELYLPLRAAGSRWFRGLNRRSGGALRSMGPLPLRRIAVARRAVAIPGVSPMVADVIDSVESSHPTPSYRTDYLRWQLERCPGVETASAVGQSSEPSAAALCWSRRVAAADWRIALWARDEGGEQASEVMDAVLAHVYARGGERVSVLASRLDSQRLAFLEKRGFISDEPNRPLYITGDVPESARELSGLSFVDTDLAYRL